jgi:RNA polymerase sigma factor (sigma-70 family)
MDDQKLIQLIHTGSNDLALKDLYRNFPMIRNLIRSRGGTRKDAEDIFQEALLIFLRKAAQPEFLLTARLSTYLYSVCRYLWNDQQSRQQPQVPFEAPTEISPAEDTNLAAAVQRESRIRLAQKALDDLKDRCRELLLLFYKKQLTLRAIADQMGYATEASAKNQKYKCLEAARTRLKELEREQSQTY